MLPVLAAAKGAYRLHVQYAPNETPQDSERIASYQDFDQFKARIREEGEDASIGMNLRGDLSSARLDSSEIGAGPFRSLEGTGQSDSSQVHLSSLEIGTAHPHFTTVIIEDCKIGALCVSERTRHLVVRRSSISTLDFLHHGTSEKLDVEIQDCNIAQVKFSPKTGLRDIIVSNCNFATSYEKIDAKEVSEIDDDIPRLDRASFSALYVWATTAKNSEIAHIARATELAIERTRATGFSKLILSGWGLLSNYGLSPMRPIFILLVLFVTFASILYTTGTQLGVTDGELVGWRSKMLSNEDNASVIRAIVGASEPITSPLSALSVRRIVIPNEAWVALLQIAYGYTVLLLVLLFGFSIRSRFRLT